MTASDGAVTGVAAPAAEMSRCGVLIVDKPTGVTSHDVLDVVRRRLREKSAGHLGTLDPAASGLLAVAIGAATRCVSVWQGGEKTYEATARFGVVTDTQDTTGVVLEQHPLTTDEGAIRAAALGLTGAIRQIPPMVSALHVRGERLYRLARRGITVEREPREVQISSWEWLGFELPLARFRVRCSSGTYVRTLVHDLGARVGTGAALESLRRLRSEPFDLSRSVTVRDLYELSAAAVWQRAGIALSDALAVLPSLELDALAVAAIGHGSAVELAVEVTDGLPVAAGPRSIAFRDAARNVLALGELEPVPGSSGAVRACPHVVFPWAVREGRR